MHSSTLLIYQQLWKEYDLSLRTLASCHKLAAKTWNACVSVQISNESEKENVFCHAILLLSRHFPGAAAIEEKVNDMIAACILTAMCIIFHTGDKALQFPAATSGVIKNINDMIVSSPVYVPTGINYLELLQEHHQILSVDMVEGARKLICVAYGSEFILLLSPLQIAASSMILTQLLENSKEAYVKIPKYEEANSIEIFYQCVLSSALSYLLSDDVRISLNSLVLQEEVTTEELSVLYAAKFKRKKPTVSKLRAANSNDSDDNDDSSSTKSTSNSSSRSVASRPICEEKRTSLGKGASGMVMKVKLQSGRSTAQKEQEMLEIYIKEVVLTSALSHKNVQNISSFDIWNKSFQMPIQAHTLEYEVDKGMIDVDICRKYSREIFEGVAYIHSYGMVHGDIKESNILISSTGVLKISDFGGSIGFITTKLYPSKFVTPIYRPRELLFSLEAEYGQEVDIWSCGIIMLIMSLGKQFRCKLIKKLKKKVEILSYDNAVRITSTFDKDMAFVIRQCLSSSLYRISAEQALSALRL